MNTKQDSQQQTAWFQTCSIIFLLANKSGNFSHTQPIMSANNIGRFFADLCPILKDHAYHHMCTHDSVTSIRQLQTYIPTVISYCEDLSLLMPGTGRSAIYRYYWRKTDHKSLHLQSPLVSSFFSFTSPLSLFSLSFPSVYLSSGLSSFLSL